MNKNIKLLKLLHFIFRVLFCAIKEKTKAKIEKINRKEKRLDPRIYPGIVDQL